VLKIDFLFFITMNRHILFDIISHLDYFDDKHTLILFNIKYSTMLYKSLIKCTTDNIFDSYYHYDGNKYWHIYNILHREDDLPAVEFPNGDKLWYNNNKYHRIDGPAKIYSNGGKYWYNNDKCQRLDGPAIEFINGDIEWRITNKLHRINGPAMEYKSGYKEWYFNGHTHRVNGPAIIYNNEYKEYKEWYINGKRTKND